MIEHSPFVTADWRSASASVVVLFARQFAGGPAIMQQQCLQRLAARSAAFRANNGSRHFFIFTDSRGPCCLDGKYKDVDFSATTWTARTASQTRRGSSAEGAARASAASTRQKTSTSPRRISTSRAHRSRRGCRPSRRRGRRRTASGPCSSSTLGGTTACAWSSSSCTGMTPRSSFVRRWLPASM